jgi:hypothetical protein
MQRGVARFLLILTMGASLQVGAAAHALDAAEVPQLQWETAEAVERAWWRLKREGDPAVQARELGPGGVKALACTDLVDLRGLQAVQDAAFGWRDTFRGRSWVRPALAEVLVRAMHLLRAERPDVWLTIGDVAQQGCGQIAHGALVRMVEDAEAGVPGAASQVVAEARRRLGGPVRGYWAKGSEFPAERDRFRRGDERVWVEQEILGHGTLPDGRAVVRLAERRFVDARWLGKPRRVARQVRRLLDLARRTWQRGTVIASGMQPVWDDASGQDVLRHVEHRIDARGGKQMLVVRDAEPVVTAQRKGKRAGCDFAAVREFRLAKWSAKKPGSWGGEQRWQPDPTQATGFARLVMLGEAGHITHLSGRDADVSFITRDNANHLQRKVRLIDAAATWRWFELLDQAANEAGTPLERILVAKRVRSWLSRAVPRDKRKNDPARVERAKYLWQHVVIVSPGHDAHHHIRIQTPRDGVDAAALMQLTEQPGAETASVARTAGREP